MTTTSEPTAISSNAQAIVLQDISDRQQQNGRNANRHLGWMVGGFAAFVLAPAILPAAIAGAGVMAGAIVTFLAANKLARDIGNGANLARIKRTVADDKFVPKLKTGAGKLLRRAAFTGRLASYTFYATIALAIGTLVPPVAAVAGAFYGLGVLATLATTGINSLVSGAKDAALATAQTTYDVRVAEGAIRPAEDLLPPALSKAPAGSTPAQDFAKTSLRVPVNDSAAPAAPAKKLDAPKP
ncbi:MAG: hypothetical protein PW788_06955 [Micavibrio sp.]|nr:hypothetical protein [Micavibrio sp.]